MHCLNNFLSGWTARHGARRPAQRRPWLGLLLACLIAAGSGLTLAPRPAAAQGALTCVNKTTANGVGTYLSKVYVSGSTIYAASQGLSFIGIQGRLSISTDGGATFTSKTTANGLGNNSVKGVYAVGSTVYAATDNGLSISTDGGATFTNKTTANGLGGNTVFGVYAVGSTVYAATNAGLSISTDGGATFTNKTTANGLGDNTVLGVYAVGSTVYAATNSGLSISTDGGATFTNKTTANGLGNNAMYGVYAVGSTVYAATKVGGLSISTDGGATFTSKTTANSLGSNSVLDVYAVGSTVYAATDNGLSISTDGGASFSNYTTANGLLNNRMYGVYAVGSTVYAASQGGLSICTPPVPQPVSQVQSNGVIIPNGDSTPSSADNTDFGNAALGGAVARSFALNNTGTLTLTLTGSPAVTVNGPNASDFTVTTQPASTVAAGGSTSFQIRFTPGATGVRTATVSIASDDSARNPYTFAVQGRSTPELTVQGNGVSIANGDATPSTTDGSDLGTVAVGAQRQQAFVLRNAGFAALTVSNLSFTGAQASDFSLVTPSSLPLTIAPNTSQTITVQLQPSVIGIRTANLVIASNDPVTPSYTFGLQGGTPLPGAALDFDGVNDYVSLPATLNSQFAANRITVEGWFNPASAAGSAASGWRGLVAEDYPGGGDVKFALFQVSSTVNCGFFTGSAWQWLLNAPITINSWQHIACTYDQQAIKLYINGVQAGSQAVSVALPAGTGAWYLGRRWDAAGYYQGRMDEVRIWNRALTQTEIQSGLNCEQRSSMPGLVARYSFNQGVTLQNNSSVTTLTDSSANNLNGALTNFTLTGSASTWVAPGGVTSGLVCGVASSVQGNGVTIANGDSTPSSADGTDFGTVLVGSALTRTFTLNNAGNAPLTLSALAPSGGAASEFVVTGLSLPATIAASSSATFNVKFTPSATGLRATTLSLTTNDSANNPYTFAVQGTGAQTLQPINQLTQQGGSSYPQPCTGSYPSRNCTLAFTLKNTSGGPLQVRYEQITAISNNVVVLNGAPSPGGVNTVVNDVQSVANNATFQPTFSLRLSSNQAYALRFKVYGYAGSSVVAAGAKQAQAVELGEYAATVTPDGAGSVNVFMPVIQR